MRPCKETDIARMKAALKPELTVTPITDVPLNCCAGADAQARHRTLDPAADAMRFQWIFADVDAANGVRSWASRSATPARTGFELSVTRSAGRSNCVRRLLEIEGVERCLGAREFAAARGGVVSATA